ncbi:MAG: response regulator [Flavobacteriales bacterium]|nr:response regulator [Bacteroidota bacterium]MCB9240061.1 response regulator [Flavobacteriales bacterium]
MPLSIALVDDSKSFLSYMEQGMHHLQNETGGEALSIQKYASGEQFIKAIPSESFDVVLLDHDLPGIDGVQVLNIVRNFDHHLPVGFVVDQIKKPVQDTISNKQAQFVLEKNESILTDLLSHLTRINEEKLLAKRLAELQTKERIYRYWMIGLSITILAVIVALLMIL